MAEKELRYIVRITNKDLDGTMPIHMALQGIKGISHRMAKMIAVAFEKETEVKFNSKLGELEEKYDKILEEIVLKPAEHGIPKWALNRQKDFETGEDKQTVMADRDLSLRKDLQRLAKIKSYRGLRHTWGLPVRGQRTKSTHRGKGGVIGVVKKDAKAAKAGGK